MVASSRDVAAYFKKEHKHVLESIDSICKRLPDFGQSNFRPTSYTDGWNREQRAIDMTRDGFTFLAMGFTGTKADAFKLAYLNDFNRMEEELRKRAQFSIPQDYASALRLEAYG